MPSFLYLGTDERFYPTLNVTVHPGDTMEADGNPDPPHFDEIGANGALNPVEPEPAAPVADEPPQEG